MQRTLLIASLACALALPALAGDQAVPGANIEEVLTMRVDGEIVVDERGNVVSHTVGTPIDAKLRDVIDRSVATWKFVPPTAGGKPARMKSGMRVTLAGREVADGTEISIDNVVFFDPNEDAKAAAKRDDVVMHITSMTRHVYAPRNFRVNGIVTMAIRANPDGTVAEVFPTQCSLYFAGGDKATFEKACKQMTDSAAKAIRTWRVGIELNGNTPTPENLTAILPLSYKAFGDQTQIRQSGLAGYWRPEARTPYRQAPWTVKDRLAQRVGTSDVTGAESIVPGQSPLQFRDATAPRAL
jgi:hypothetical protein